jgi:hypothetical protein
MSVNPGAGPLPIQRAINFSATRQTALFELKISQQSSLLYGAPLPGSEAKRSTVLTMRSQHPVTGKTIIGRWMVPLQAVSRD